MSATKKSESPGGGSRARRLRASLLELEQLDLEHQRRVGRDHAAGAARAVTELGRDQQRALRPDLHAGNAFVPALDDLPVAEREGEGAAAIERAVELGALGAVDPEPSGVVHHASLAGGRGRTRTR